VSEGRIALVVQRYGEEVVGGSESLCRTVAEMLAPGRPVDVLTTCARDYVTWRNEYPAGESTLNGVGVHRFTVDFERGPAFHRSMAAILGGATLDDYHRQGASIRSAIASSSREAQIECLRLQGPYSTPLLDFLHRHSGAYDLVVFFTYLYPTTYFGCQQVPTARRALVPTAHDEAPIHFPVFHEMFASFPTLIFLTPEERHFVQQTFAVSEARRVTIGMPVELPALPDAAHFRAKFGIDGPFLLYAGRIDPSKGCDVLARDFMAARAQLPAGLQLVLIGSKAMSIPHDARIRFLGALDDGDKLDAMAAATLLVNPSPFESFSIVTLEAMLCGSPVLVNGRCAVLKGHVERSQAGLYYMGAAEFVEAILYLCDRPDLRSRMGRNGQEYASRNYGRERVSRQYERLLAGLVPAGRRD
jgi:glycosyltransferase involved in cell wall biosynthesis